MSYISLRHRLAQLWTLCNSYLYTNHTDFPRCVASQIVCDLNRTYVTLPLLCWLSLVPGPRPVPPPSGAPIAVRTQSLIFAVHLYLPAL